MLLAALPGTVGDGGDEDGHQYRRCAVRPGRCTTFVGAAPGRKLRRFLVGPKECEITGSAETPDGRALFVNIQHPGERHRS